MGFSVTITSSIILIVMFALASTLLITIFQGFREVSYAAGEHLRLERERSEVALQLSVNSANTTSCVFTVKNVGSRVIFLERQNGFSWNTIILSYSDGSTWHSYPIENYQVLEVKVSNTSYTFDPASHPYINPGEEATIFLKIPQGSPRIPDGGLISVVFVTHYGVAVYAEALAEGSP